MVSYSGTRRVSFSILAGSNFRYPHGFYRIPVLARILPFVGIHTDSKLLRYSPGQFFGTRTDSTRSRYWPGFYYFSVFTLVVTFCRTRRDSLSVLATILRDPGITPDSIICRYSH